MGKVTGQIGHLFLKRPDASGLLAPFAPHPPRCGGVGFGSNPLGFFFQTVLAMAGGGREGTDENGIAKRKNKEKRRWGKGKVSASSGRPHSAFDYWITIWFAYGRPPIVSGILRSNLFPLGYMGASHPPLLAVTEFQDCLQRSPENQILPSKTIFLFLSCSLRRVGHST